MNTSTPQVRTRYITTLSTLLPRWDTTPFLHMAMAGPIMDLRTPRLLYLLCTLTRSRLLLVSPHIGLELRTRQPHNSPSRRQISPSTYRSLSPNRSTWLGALVKYVVFIVNVVVGTTLFLTNGRSSSFCRRRSYHPIPLRAAHTIPICSIYLLISRSAYTSAVDPLCFLFSPCSFVPLATIPPC